MPEFVPGALHDALHVIGEPDHAQLVDTGAGGVTVWPLSAASVALLDWPDDKPIVAEPAVAALAEQLFKRNVTLQQEAQRRLQALQSPWDLAQFDLVNSNRARLWKRCSAAAGQLLRAPRWRAARIALVALLLVNLAGLNAWAWKEQSLIQAQRVAIRELLTRTFPEVKVVVDAPLQMARQVATLQQASGALAPRDLESLLGALGAAAPAGSVPNAIDVCCWRRWRCCWSPCCGGSVWRRRWQPCARPPRSSAYSTPNCSRCANGRRRPRPCRRSPQSPWTRPDAGWRQRSNPWPRPRN